MGIINQLKEKLTSYIDVYIKLAKLNFIGHTASLLSYLMYALIGMFIFFCISLFLGFGLVEVFVEAGLSKMVSFFMVIGIYLLIMILVVVLRKQITRFFASGFIHVLTQGDEEDEEKKNMETN